MRATTVESLKQKLEKARALERSIAERMVKAKKAAARDALAREKEARRRRGEIIEEHREEVFDAHPDVAAKVLGWLDQVLTDPNDRALFGLANAGSSPVV